MAPNRLVLACLLATFALASQAAAAEVTLWNYDVLQNAERVTEPPPLGPVHLVAARGGTFSGAVAVESAEPISGLKAHAGPLRGAGGAAIPAGNVRVRYAVPWAGLRNPPTGLDILLETPPEATPLYGERSLTGVWVTVDVPADARPGQYQGQLTIEAEGLARQSVPVVLDVTDWRVPGLADRKVLMEMIQSPDTLALEYDLPLWSERHWELIARSFRLIRRTGSRTVFVTLLRQTNQGNAESMIRWKRGTDGSLTPDYSVMERYLDVAEENLGKPERVVFYAWDVYLVRSFRGRSYKERPKVDPKADGYAQGQQRLAVKRWEKKQQGVTVTMIDPKTGATEPGALPHYDKPESRDIWKPVYDELRRRMRKRGLEDAMVLGMVTDMQPSKEEIAFLHEVTGGLPWICHSHYRRMHRRPPPNGILYGIADVAYEAHAYNLTWHVNPALDPIHGWRTPEDRVYIDRFGLLNGYALRIRQLPQLNITGDQRGLGRIGGDFWPAIRDKRGRRVGKAFSRYPENHWRGLNVANYLLAPGRDGAVTTARFENLCEGIQECEARIQIEIALLEDEAQDRLGTDLVRRAHAALDDHQWALWHSYWTNRKQLEKLGAISGRSIYEALWGGLSRAGVKMPGFWDSKARHLRADENRKGHDWFVESDWEQRNRELFEVAAEIQQRLR